MYKCINKYTDTILRIFGYRGWFWNASPTINKGSLYLLLQDTFFDCFVKRPFTHFRGGEYTNARAQGEKFSFLYSFVYIIMHIVTSTSALMVIVDKVMAIIKTCS